MPCLRIATALSSPGIASATESPISVTCWAPVERAGDAAAAISAASATSVAMTPLIAPIVDERSEKLRSEQPTPYEALAVPARASYSPDPAGRGARVG